MFPAGSWLLRPRSVVIFDEIEKAHSSMLRSKLHTALSSGTMQHKRNASKVSSLEEEEESSYCERCSAPTL